MSGCGAFKTFDLGQWPRKADSNINSEISLFGVVMWDRGRSSVLSWLATAYIAGGWPRSSTIANARVQIQEVPDNALLKSLLLLRKGYDGLMLHYTITPP